ncbi:MAG: molybdenum cofactor biosynthesis protein MoaE [Armatimonadota bacterium]|nr:molybdenum cofactor biosynthesis protein MoaE [Armatimonadota bacterium]
MIALTHEPIDPPQLVSAVEDEGHGAVVSFLGVVRNNARGRSVSRLEYGGYEPMALRLLRTIAEEVEGRWQARAAIVHRLGTLEIGEVSVAIAVASPHRAAAFEACRYAIERIKAEVPIWKKEFYSDGAAWIEEVPSGGNEPPG